MVQVNPDFRRRLDAIPDRVRAVAAREMELGAEEMVRDMRAAAPYDAATPDGIHLRDHIGWTWGDAPAGAFTMGEIRSGKDAGVEYSALRITVYANPKDKKGRPYASWVEFGTKSGNTARPFFWPVYRLHKRRIRARVLKAIREELKRG